MIWHVSINLLAVALYCVNFWLRLNRPLGDNLPLTLSIIGVALIVISGWLGGELVYVRGAAVREPPARPKCLTHLSRDSDFVQPLLLRLSFKELL